MKKIGIGDAELRLLSYLADNGPLTVREVWERFGMDQGYVRTTVLQMMERLRAKGLVVRKASGVGWQYRTVSEKSGLLRNAVDRFVENSLSGSLSPFVQYLVDAPNLTTEDVAALTELVERLKAHGEGEK